jgi:hypothetical protein
MGADMSFNCDNCKIVLWGHKTIANTFHYINVAYERTFKHLGFNVSWMDDNDDVSNFDFSNSIFFTEGQVDGKIPLREDCFYILHNCYDQKYNFLYDKNRCARMQTYTDDALKYNLTKLEDCIYADYEGKCIYFPWATDLLPYEIENNKPSKSFNSDSRIINWVGTIGGEKFGNIDQITPFKKACEKQGITFSHAMAGKSTEENIDLIKTSYMAPTIVGKWQHEVGYIPCRIFKNISYGQMGITNSPRIYELFQHKVIHNNDTYWLFYDAKNYMEKMPLSELHSLMDFVKDKHTYINRINTVMGFIDHLLR